MFAHWSSSQTVSYALTGGFPLPVLSLRQRDLSWNDMPFVLCLLGPAEHVYESWLMNNGVPPHECFGSESEVRYKGGRLQAYHFRRRHVEAVSVILQHQVGRVVYSVTVA